jgi:PAS domain S-box-containing protein
MWGPHIGGGTPRDFGPCGDVLDQNRTLLFQHFERRYPYFVPIIPLVEECLLVPFYVGGKAVGTIWAIMHSDRRKFDAEDERLMNTLGQFASLAYQTVESIADLKSQIAAREKAEAAVRAMASGLEAKVRCLIDANIMGIFIWHLDGRIVDANEAFLRIVGYGRDDLSSGRLRWRELTPAEWRAADDRRVAELEATGTAQPHEKEYFRKDGSRVPVLVGAATFEGMSDEGAAFVFDLTDRKKADEAVRASEIRWRTMFEKFPVGIVLRDAEHRYMSANPAFQQMVGYSERELIHLSPLDITHEDDRPASERMLTELQSGVRQTVEKEKRFRRKDGSVVWTMVSTFHIPEAGPIPAFYPAIVVDITKRKQAEEALRESELELARVSRLTTMGELAASIAHELRQPLSAAVTNGTTCQHWLSEDTLDLARARKAAQRMIAAAQRASEVMDRIRGLINKTSSEKISVVVNDLICETLALIETELRARQIVVATDLAEPPISIVADRVQLQQVVLNLIMNAAEAMSLVADRTRLLRISSQREPPSSVLIRVADAGTGLDPTIAERIFDPFFTTKAGGVGMGLSICRSIIDGHGGRLWASPAPSYGALVQFTLPTEDSVL